MPAKAHTGRSRNDQVALDMKLYTRDEIGEIDKLLKKLLETLLGIMEENIETYMPGFTHLQKAQPITLAHHFGAYFEMFKRDRQRLADIYKRMNLCPLGSGALAGTTYPLDREMTAQLLGFDGPTLNSMDSVSDRDYLIELLSAMSTIMMHLSRFCEEIILWNSMNTALWRSMTLTAPAADHAAEEKPGYRRAGKRKDRPCLRSTDLHADHDERHPAGIQQRHAGRQRADL